MKLALASDIHLEFAAIELFNDENADALILSGDIMVANDLLERDAYEIRNDRRSDRFHKFFQECCSRFKDVIYIVGNHEHYHGDFKFTLDNIRQRLGYLTNLHILDKEMVKLGDINFIGATLWTDMNKEDPLTLYEMRRMMNDFRCVDNSNRISKLRTYLPDPDNPGKELTVFKDRPSVFLPEDAAEDHKKFLEYIKTMVDGKHGEKFVIVGHHAPSKQSTKPRYKDHTIMNGGYSSDLTEFILDRPQIKAWTHGHTHDTFDYMIGSTRIICNPRGYEGYESRADEFKLQYFEV